MSYTELAFTLCTFAILSDLFLTKTSLVTRKFFWVSYAIVLPFQLLTNWWLTGRNIVMYSPATIIGPRIAGAPIEDLIFGFTLILITLSTWSWLTARKVS